MTFYPDGPPEIPNQLPIPGARQPDVGSGARLTRALVRTAVINGVLLLLAVVLAFVVPIVDDRGTALGIVIGAVALGAIHTTVVVMSETRRRKAALAAIPVPPRPASNEPAVAPYGAVVAEGFSLTVEDVFSIAGRGTVVTGRVSSGEVRTGQRVRVLRVGQVVAETTVTGVEMFRRRTEVASTGDNVGLLLAEVSRSDVGRGDIITG